MNRNNSNKDLKDTQEIPITAHIFEGHLYLKENNKWTWRLFRFDGSSLTCLSSKRNKLPPNTLLDLSTQSMADTRPISFLTSSSTLNSLTSPLLATPKNKSAIRLSSSFPSSTTINDINTLQQQQQPAAIASYYQLPKWTIDMMNMSSISILKPTSNKSKNPFNSLTANDKSKTFSIRTYDGGLYIMKAQKQHDLERWIFVLAKMWKFTQAARELYPQQQQASMPMVAAAGPPPALPRHLYANNSLNQQQYTATPIIMSGGIDNQEVDHMPNQLQAQQGTGNRRSSSGYKLQQGIAPTPSPLPPVCLSAEKVVWIEEWIKSLAELAACGDSTSELDYKEAYESLDHVHVHEPSLIKSSSRTTSRRKSSIRKRPSMSKRSPTSFSKRKMKDNNFNMDFFQDVNTIYTGTDDASSSSRKSATAAQQPQDHHQSSLKYHSSTRQQKIKLVRNNTSPPPPPPLPIQDNITDPHIPPVIINDPSIHHYSSPLENLKKRVSSSQCTLSNYQQQQEQETKEEAADENVCLADVQKFLQKMDINKQDYNKTRPNSSTFINNSTFSAKNNRNNRNSWAPDVSTLFFT